MSSSPIEYLPHMPAEAEGMRDRLIHGYFGVDYELVWDVVANKIPVLRDQLANLLHELDSE